MSVRGLSEVEASSIGAAYLTAAEGSATAGDADGRPLNGSFANVDAFDPNPGVTSIGATGTIRTTFFPVATAGATWPIELRLTRYSPELLELIQTEFAAGPAFDVTINLVDGRQWVGSAKADRTGGQSPIQTTSDHPHYGGQGKELILKMLATEGGFV